MKNLFLLILTLMCHPLIAYEVKVRLVDEVGEPVVGAEVKIIFESHLSESVNRVVSDSDGRCRANGRGDHSVMVKAFKPGHYHAQFENLLKDRDHDVEVVLPRILNPIPLYALSDVRIKFPVQNWDKTVFGPARLISGGG